MDAAAHHPQWPPAHRQGVGMVVKPMEEYASAMAAAISTTASGGNPPPERKPRPQKEQALNCPRCNSTNTKFCYYNNYSLTQPRYFCKACRRYWTEGGSLRNVPVGGGSRKNKRSFSTSASASSAINGAPPYKKLPVDFITPPSSIPAAAPTFHEFADRYPGLLAPLTPPEFAPATVFGLEEFRSEPPPPQPTLSFGLDALGGYGGKTALYPFEELKPPPLIFLSDNYSVEQHHRQFEHDKGLSGGDHPPGFWSGAINGAGGSW